VYGRRESKKKKKENQDEENCNSINSQFHWKNSLHSEQKKKKKTQGNSISSLFLC
jgi:hypothetical protein